MSQLAWYGRDGSRLGPVGDPGMCDVISMSPDDTHLAVQFRSPETTNYDIGKLELSTGIPEGKMMSVEVKGGRRLETGAPKVLFQSRVRTDNNGQPYAVAGAGKRFIFMEPVEEGSKPFTVVLNWPAGLKR